MSVSFSTLLTGVIGVSLVHSLVPHHWLPFVLVGRKQGWKTRKTLTLLGTGALVHTLSTIAVGLLVGYLGHEIDRRFAVWHGMVPGLILLAFGSGFFLSSNHSFHPETSEKVAASSLILMLGLSPCVAVAPFFLMIGSLGFGVVLKISLIMSLLSVAGMTLLGWFACESMNSFKLEWLERNESRVMGSLLMLLGVSFIIF